jgi:indolepyruvate ferredoxin oxidoreductase
MAYRLDDKYALAEGEVFLTGVQALVRMPLDQQRADRAAGLRTATLVSGYQGSPLAVYDSELAAQGELLRAHDVVHQPAVNEELGATAVLGSQLAATRADRRHDGVVGIWYGKAPGLDRALDAIRHANLIGVAPSGGAVALVGDDAIAKSSTIPSACEHALHDAQLPVLYPGDVQEVLDLGRHAVALSRAAGVWVGMKIATNVADGSATVRVGLDRVAPIPVQIELDGRPYVHVPNAKLVAPVPLELERSLHARVEAARRYGAVNGLNRIAVSGPADVLGIVAAGKTSVDVRHALRRLGLRDGEDLHRFGIRLLHVGMPFPLDGALVREFAQGLKEMLVVEEKRPFLEPFVREALYGRDAAPAISGKHDPQGAPLVPHGGELDPDAVAQVMGARLAAHRDIGALADRLAALRPALAPAPLPVHRTPYFCSGCPHNSSLQTPEGATVGAGIGCHGLVVLMEGDGHVGDILGMTQMGGEGAQWVGMAPFVETPHAIQNLGDGTFFHSGSLAVRAAVAAGADITFKLLYNSAVAMTGGQAAPGATTVPALTRLLEAEGVRRIVVTTEDPGRYRGVALATNAEVWGRERIVEAQELLADGGGVTVLIHDQECATELRRKRKRGKVAAPAERVLINERVCEGCGDCGVKSNCLSVQPVETDFGRKTRIHQASCNQDLSCLDGDCPSFLTVVPAKGRAAGPPAVAALDGAVLPEPAPRVPADAFGLRITGVGGTGVVTVAQIVGVAALLDGRSVRGLDQTGLAQKGGPVVSDLRIGAAPWAAPGKLGRSECDLYLGCDLLVAAEERNLAVADADRTVAVLSTARVPTGGMVVDTALAFPDVDALVARIGETARPDGLLAFDAALLARRLFGGEQTANVLLLGAAYQAGALPLPAAAIEQAIELNGTAVALNLQAFRRGRQVVADPDALEAALTAAAPAPVAPAAPDLAARGIAAHVRAPEGSELERLVASRVGELIGYQGPAYARRYAERVERVRAVEAERTPQGTGALTEAVAFHLHKLMAYKDEYEVARLHLDPALKQAIEAEFGPGARFRWKLHPPLLRALGMKRKIGVGPWFGSVYRLLYALRRVRGTPLDLFGYAEVRRVERALIREYEALLDELTAALVPATHALCVELAATPDLVRGYEHVKLAGVERFHGRVAELRERLSPAGAA